MVRSSGTISEIFKTSCYRVFIFFYHITYYIITINLFFMFLVHIIIFLGTLLVEDHGVLFQ